MNDQVIGVAKRMKELREIVEYTPQEVADELNVPLETYLAYENAQLDIPVGVIYGAASFMGVDPTELLSGDIPRMNTYTIVRQGRGMTVERYKEYTFTSLAFNFVDRDMEPMIVDLLPKETPPELVTHHGQEFNYVLEGKICVLFGGKQIFLEAGDSIYFDPSVPHGQLAVGGAAKFLTIINE